MRPAFSMVAPLSNLYSPFGAPGGKFLALDIFGDFAAGSNYQLPVRCPRNPLR